MHILGQNRGGKSKGEMLRDVLGVDCSEKVRKCGTNSAKIPAERSAGAVRRDPSITLRFCSGEAFRESGLSSF